MNSDTNELQMDQPFALVRCVTNDTRSSAMLLTRQGHGSDAIITMAVPNGYWKQNIKRTNETIRALLIVY